MAFDDEREQQSRFEGREGGREELKQDKRAKVSSRRRQREGKGLRSSSARGREAAKENARC